MLLSNRLLANQIRHLGEIGLTTDPFRPNKALVRVGRPLRHTYSALLQSTTALSASLRPSV